MTQMITTSEPQMTMYHLQLVCKQLILSTDLSKLHQYVVDLNQDLLCVYNPSAQPDCRHYSSRIDLQTKINGPNDSKCLGIKTLSSDLHLMNLLMKR